MTRIAPADLAQGAGPAAARIALGHLAAATRAARHLRGDGETEALHDARVALRRLRTILKAYASQLKKPAAKRVRRRLRALGHASAAARDAEVQLAWLATLRPASPPEDAARAWLAARLRARREAAHRAVRSGFRAELAALESSLRPMLVKARRPRAGGAAYGETTARLLAEHIAELAARLRAVGGPGDRAAVHRARIAGKRLRYLLEPLADVEPAAAVLVGEMKRFQDRLGDLVDAHVRTDALTDAAAEAAAQWAPAAVRSLVARGSDRVADPDVLVGLFALALRTRAEIETGYAAVRERYLDTTAWLAPARRLAARLRDARAPQRDRARSSERRARTA